MIDYDEMATAVRELLRSDISCTEGADGTFTSEIYADYRDEMPNATAAKILNAPDPLQAFWETLDEWYSDCELYYRDELEQRLRASLTEGDGLCPAGLTDAEMDQLHDIVMDLVSYSYPEDHYMNQGFCVNIMVDTGDGDHDFVLNDVIPSYCSYYGEPLDSKASIVWLAKTQGYSKTQLRKALHAGDMVKPVGFLESMRVEVANICTHMNTLTFLVRLTLRELISLNTLIQHVRRQRDEGRMNTRQSGYIILGKSTETGLFDPWSGGGSCFEIELERDVKLPIRFIRSALPDGGDGYSVERSYGMLSAAWARGTVTSICAPKNLQSA